MSCKAACFSFLLFLLTAAPQAFGQAAPAAAAGNAASGGLKHGAGLGFGQVWLIGDFNTNFSNGLGFSLIYNMEFGSRFSLFTNLYYNSHSSPLSGTAETDSLSMIGVVPNLKFNALTIDKLTVAAIGGLGLLKVSQTTGTYEAGLMMFTMQGGVQLNVDFAPFRFGPAITYMVVPEATAAAKPENSQPPITMGGSMMKLFFNVTYFF